MTLYIAEYPGLAGTAANEGAVAVLPHPPTVQEALATGAASSYSPVPLQQSTAFIEMCTDTTCSILLLPFATLSTYTFTTQVGRLNANERIIWRVPCSPQWGGASTISQQNALYGIVTSASS
jgi:hypothetical protein